MTDPITEQPAELHASATAQSNTIWITTPRGIAFEVSRTITEDELHPCPGEWQWWASYDGGEHLVVGPAESKEALINLLKTDRGGEYQDGDGKWRIRAHIGQYRENNNDLAKFIDIESILDLAADEMDKNESGADEDGDNHPVDDLTTEQIQELQALLRSATRGWQSINYIKLQSRMVNQFASEEFIDIALPDRREA